MLIIWGSESEKTNALLNSITGQVRRSLINKIYLYAKDINVSKYQFLIKRREDVGIKHLNGTKPFIEHSDTLDDVYEDIN